MWVARAVRYGNHLITQELRRSKQESESSLNQRIMGSEVQLRKRLTGAAMTKEMTMPRLEIWSESNAFLLANAPPHLLATDLLSVDGA